MTLKAVVFDLDDTLYDSKKYFSSAFKQIARFLANRFSPPEEQVLETLWSVFLSKGSLYPKLFNDVLAFYNLDNPDCLKTLVDMFHNAPVDSLTLYEDVKNVLPWLALRYRLGLITNGYPEMQRRKVMALGLDRLFQVQIYTAEFGKPKPDKFGYQHAVTIVNVKPEECVYVGDNPFVDFTGAKEVGMYTVRMLRGEFAEVRTNSEFIDIEVKNFYELMERLRTW